MTKWTTIRIRKRTKAQAESDKDESETWDEYLRRCNPQIQTEKIENKSKCRHCGTWWGWTEFCSAKCEEHHEQETETETDTEREFCDLEDLTIDEDKLHGRIDDLETEIKMKIEQETRR